MRRNARGGSTIPGRLDDHQQDRERSLSLAGGGYVRKAGALSPLLIENIWSKRRIMEVYLTSPRPDRHLWRRCRARRYFVHGAVR